MGAAKLAQMRSTEVIAPRTKPQDSGQTKAEVKDKLKALHSELDAGLETAGASRLHAFIVLCLLTGVRSEEARALTWEHVDLEAGTISVWRSVRAHGDTKTNRSRRTLKLPEIAVEALWGRGRPVRTFGIRHGQSVVPPRHRRRDRPYPRGRPRTRRHLHAGQRA